MHVPFSHGPAVVTTGTLCTPARPASPLHALHPSAPPPRLRALPASTRRLLTSPPDSQPRALRHTIFTISQTSQETLHEVRPSRGLNASTGLVLTAPPPSDLAQISPLKHAEADFGLLSPGQSLTPHLGESPARKQGDAWSKE